MIETKKTDPNSFVFLSQYVKDISFENYAAQSLNFTTEKLSHTIDLNIKRKQVASDVLEITLLFLLEANTGSEKVFVLEISYAATFSIKIQKGSKEQKKIAFIDCPNIMFPYLRQIVYNISRDSGYPPVNLDHIDFKKIFDMKIVD